MKTLSTENGVISYEMYSKAGDRACHRLVTQIHRRLESRKRYTRDEIMQMIYDGMRSIAEKHGEVYDTEPRQHIFHRVNNDFKRIYGGDLDYDA